MVKSKNFSVQSEKHHELTNISSANVLFINHAVKSKENQKNNKFLQVDGNDDLKDSKTIEPIDKHTYALNCEDRSVVLLLNFIRNFYPLWSLIYIHPLCDFQNGVNSANCFFCLVRSLCIRLNEKRFKGPKNVKPFEFVFQLSKYDVDGWKWEKITQM